MKKILLVLLCLSTYGTLMAQQKPEYKITFEIKWEHEDEQLMVLHESNGENGNLAHAQQGKLINSGWKHTYRTTDEDNPLMCKVGTIKPKRKEKAIINLYVNDKLVATKTGKTGWFMKNPLSLMVYISDIKDKL